MGDMKQCDLYRLSFIFDRT